jgi:hypothetical protein
MRFNVFRKPLAEFHIRKFEFSEIQLILQNKCIVSFICKVGHHYLKITASAEILA